MNGVHMRLWEKGKEMHPFLILHSPFLLCSPTAFRIIQNLKLIILHCEKK